MALKARQTCLGSEARVGGRQKSNSDGVLGKQRSYAGGRKRTAGAKKQARLPGAPMKQPQAAGRRQCLVGKQSGGRSSIRRRQGAVDSLVLWGRQGTSSSRDSGQGAAHTQQERSRIGRKACAVGKDCLLQLMPDPHGRVQSTHSCTVSQHPRNASQCTDHLLWHQPVMQQPKVQIQK